MITLLFKNPKLILIFENILSMCKYKRLLTDFIKKNSEEKYTLSIKFVTYI